MKQSFYYKGYQEKEIFAQKWDVENSSAKGVVQIAHGMDEHIGRYEYFANVLTQYGQYNKSFHPARTPFDWLSQDNEAVDLYVNDPYCGGVFTAGFFYDLLTGIKQISNLANIKLVPSSLPIYLISGEHDPVGSYTKGVLKVYNDFKKAGLQDVSYRFFTQCRHELLNELNKDEVIEDILSWLDVQVDKKTVRV
jgi:alpha-beta hydrolase superfamily lysophospholipase